MTPPMPWARFFGACRPTRPEDDALVCLKWRGWRHSFRSRQSVHYSVPPIIILYKTANFLYGTANVLYIEQNIFLCRLSFEDNPNFKTIIYSVFMSNC